MFEVYPDIFLIKEEGALGAAKPPENIYVIAGSNGIIYDAGYGTKKDIKHVFKELKEIEEYYKAQNKDFRLTRILPSHSHPDHFSGLNRLRDSLGLKTILTKKMADVIRDKESFYKSFDADDFEDYLRIRNKVKRKIRNFFRLLGSKLFYQHMYGVSFLDDPDEIIEENSDILINGETWKIFPSPGHCKDHISLYNEQKGILFSGDNVLRSITTWLGPPESNINDYITSIEQFKKLPNLKLILTAHGSPIENPHERLDEILKHRKEREQQVLNIIHKHSERGISPKGIIKTIYANESRFLHTVARGWVVLTLKKLENNNQIKRQVTKNKILFFPV
ncbi:MAG: MBL fold metallo-hydrolase [Promethearchaeota archaeon]|nr:MAG: MBL fold metallo-hydrolase [Candidatus Lokiarchaeota archaeon]